MSEAKDLPPDESTAAGQAPETSASNPAAQTRSGAHRAAAAALHLPLPSAFRPLGNGWMVTFTDLIALMLTFFVLLFSMSSLEKQKWRELAGALSEQLNSMTLSDAPRPTVVLQIKTEKDPVPGADLDYLERVLREQLAAEPALDTVSLRRGDGGVILSLPAATVFDGVGVGTTDTAGQMAYPLARLLQNLGNGIEITVFTGGEDAHAGFRSVWDLALARAKGVSDLLLRAGYDGPLVARAVAAARAEPAAGLAPDRIDIVVTREARGTE